MPVDKPHWADLYTEVVTSGLCTGCAACVVVCPYDVLGYDDSEGNYKPFHVAEDGGTADCTHGVKGCTLCTRACPRFREWETEIDTFMFGRERLDEEVFGVSQDVVLVSAILIHALENDVIDAALVSYLEGDGTSWKAVPGVATTREQVLAA